MKIPTILIAALGAGLMLACAPVQTEPLPPTPDKATATAEAARAAATVEAKIAATSIAQKAVKTAVAKNVAATTRAQESKANVAKTATVTARQVPMSTPPPTYEPWSGCKRVEEGLLPAVSAYREALSMTNFGRANHGEIHPLRKFLVRFLWDSDMVNRKNGKVQLYDELGEPLYDVYLYLHEKLSFSYAPNQIWFDDKKLSFSSKPADVTYSNSGMGLRYEGIIVTPNQVRHREYGYYPEHVADEYKGRVRDLYPHMERLLERVQEVCPSFKWGLQDLPDN